MLKKIAILTTSLLLLASVTVLAQNNSTPQVETDYYDSFDYYLTLLRDFQLERQNWQQKPTLQGEQELLASGIQLARTRNQTWIYYLNWLKTSLQPHQPNYSNTLKTINLLDSHLTDFRQLQKNLKPSLTTDRFNSLMLDYRDQTKTRQRQLSQTQIELKLANLKTFQARMIKLYQPVKNNLQDSTDPQIVSGFKKVTQLDTQINDLITQTSQTTQDHISGNRTLSQVFRRANQQLTRIKSLQLELIDIIIELEKYYVQ